MQVKRNIREEMVQVLKERHAGEDNYISGSQLGRLFNIDNVSVRYHINKLRTQGMPIGSHGKGYYYITSLSELEATKGQLLGRALKIQAAIDGLVSAQTELNLV